ncbi:MAG: FtsH protease activity modulator HflK [Luteolibacter sp.]|jgi:modulator of FtsH protease HflK
MPTNPPPIPSLQGNPVRTIVISVVGLVLLYGVFTCFYTVKTESQAVVLRFGKPIKTEEPGLRFKIPFGVDRQIPVEVRRQLKQEFGFATSDATDPWQFSDMRTQEEEKSMVTGDLNAAQVEWVVQYRIEDPKQFLFEVRDPKGTLRHLSESVMRWVVGDRTVDEVITIGRREIEQEAAAKLQQAVSDYTMGLMIDQVQLINVNPPQRVQASFNEVNQAQQQRESVINVANGQFNKEVPRARGEADRMISAAQGYAMKRVNEAEGDVAAFEALLTEYSRAPAITRQRIYLETMSKVLPKVGRTVIIDEDTTGLLPFLNLSETAQPLPAAR